MDLLILVALLFGCIIVSSVLDQVVSRLSLPLIQIGLGLALALIFPKLSHVDIDSEVFLALFIAPLLFEEARHSSKFALWVNRRDIVSLAVGLVLASVLAAGWVLHALVPAVPLAAAFAMAAALGPTDAAAVGALSKTVSLTRRQETLLGGEALINDASGVVCFQFAVAAAMTGDFSPGQALASFALLFIGGLAAGALMGALARAFITVLRALGYETTMVHVLYEVCTPFVVFLLAEGLHVSGILAVVAAGLVMARSTPRLSSSEAARKDLVSSSVWELIVFLINGTIFVLLGMQLPLALSASLSDAFGLPRLILLVVVLTAVITLVRWIWTGVMELIHRDPATGLRGTMDVKAALHRALVTTIAGPKGAVTLSIIMTLPYMLPDARAFPMRSLLVFLTAGIILLTLLMAVFILPLLAPGQESDGQEEQDLHQATIAVLEGTIKAMTAMIADHQNPEYEPAAQLTIGRYRARLARERFADQGCGPAMQDLADDVYKVQNAHATDLQRDLITERGIDAALPYFTMLPAIRSSLGYTGRYVRLGIPARTPGGGLRLVLHRLQLSRRLTDNEEMAFYDACLLAVELERAAVTFLEHETKDKDEHRARAARVLRQDHYSRLKSLWGRLQWTGREGVSLPDKETLMTGQLPAGFNSSLSDLFRKSLEHAELSDATALQMEMEQIANLRASGQISDAVARKLRQNVYILQMNLAN